MDVKQSKKLCIQYIKLALQAEKSNPRLFHEIRIIRHLDGAFFMILKFKNLDEIKPYMNLISCIRKRISEKFKGKCTQFDIPKRLRCKLGMMSSIEKWEWEHYCERRKNSSTSVLV